MTWWWWWFRIIFICHSKNARQLVEVSICVRCECRAPRFVCISQKMIRWNFVNRCDHRVSHTRTRTTRNLYCTLENNLRNVIENIGTRLTLFNTLSNDFKLLYFELISSGAWKYHNFVNFYFIENDGVICTIWIGWSGNSTQTNWRKLFFAICYYFEWSIMYYA